MHRKLVAACVGIAASMSFVAVPVASASPVLTSEGKAVAIGKEVKGNNTGIIQFESVGEGEKERYVVQCTSASLIAKVTANSGSKVELESAAGAFTFSGTDVNSDCTTTWAPGKITWGKLCFGMSNGTDSVSVTGCGSAVTMTTNLTGLAVCTYTAASVTATMVTNSDATLNLSSIPLAKKEGGFFCPTQITFFFDLDLTTSGGGTLSIS